MKPNLRFLVAGLILSFCAQALAQAGAPQQGWQGESAQSQGGAVTGGMAGMSLSLPTAAQNPLLRGVPSGAPTPVVLPLSLKDAVDRGLRYNLGITVSTETVKAFESARLRALSALLPHVSVQSSETVEQINLASLGFTGSFTGVPPIIGPFSVFDIRANLSQSILNMSQWSQLRANNNLIKAAGYSSKNTRDAVVLICVQLYMQTVTSGSRVDAAQAQFKTAQTLYDLAVNRHNAGFVPGIEVLRAQVQLQAQQQRVLVARNEFARQKLNLAQAIGLPLGQEFQLTEQLSYATLPGVSLESALQDAYSYRGDYLSAAELVKAAEEARQAASRQRLPTADLNANYGDIGPRPWQSHGTFLVQVNVRMPVFQGGEIEARIQAADAQLAQQRADLESLRARIYYEIRTAFLDLKSSEERVQVARNSLDLANQQVTQAQDRFAAGVASNIEVVQAQDALAVATEDFISSLFAHNLAKANLAQAMGMAESDYGRFLRGK